jgi:hypothetical protein
VTTPEPDAREPVLPQAPPSPPTTPPVAPDPATGQPTSPLAPGYPQPYRAPAGAAYPTPQDPTPQDPTPGAAYAPAAYPPAGYAAPGYPPAGYGQSPHGQVPYATPVASRPASNGSAVTAFVLALLSFFVLPIVLAVVALVVAGRAEQEMAADPTRSGGRGLLSWARGLAIANLIIFGLFLLFVGAVVVGLFVGNR